MVLALELDQFQGQTGINTKGDNFWKKGCDLLVELDAGNSMAMTRLFDIF